MSSSLAGTIANLNDATPAAPANAVNVEWQSTAPYTGPTGYPQRDVSANLKPFSGDTGSGGGPGAVPAPVAGDGPAGFFLRADGLWASPPGGGSLPTGPEPANTVLAGPTSGSSATPTFRVLVAKDIPSSLNPTGIVATGASALQIQQTNGANVIVITDGTNAWEIYQTGTFLAIWSQNAQVNVIEFGPGGVVVNVPMTAPTPVAGDNSQNVATTAYVQAAISTAISNAIANLQGLGGTRPNSPPAN